MVFLHIKEISLVIYLMGKEALDETLDRNLQEIGGRVTYKKGF